MTVKVDSVVYPVHGYDVQYDIYVNTDTSNISVILISGPDTRAILTEPERGKPFGTLVYQYCAGTTRHYYTATSEWPYILQRLPQINSSFCGYIIPPVTDPIPSNVTYGVKYRMLFTDLHPTSPVNWQVDILKQNYTGDLIPLTGGSSPLTIKYSNSGEDKFAPIRGSEAIIKVIQDGTWDFSELYSTGEKGFKVLVYQNSVLYWAGFITPDNCQQPWLYPPFELSIPATDGLGLLKGILYYDASGNLITSLDSCLTILSRCLGKTDLLLDLVTGVNIYEQTDAAEAILAAAPTLPHAPLPNDPLSSTGLNYTLFINQGSPLYLALDCYAILEMLCKAWTAVLFQSGGKWYFVRPNELTSPIWTRTYPALNISTIPGAVQINPSANLGNGASLIHCNKDQLIRLFQAYLSVELDFNYDKPSPLILNEDFSIYTSNGDDPDLRDTTLLSKPGTFPDFWTPHGEITAWIGREYGGSLLDPTPGQSYTQSCIIVGQSGNLPIESDPIYLESLPVKMTKGDLMQFSGNAYSDAANMTIQIAIVLTNGTDTYYYGANFFPRDQYQTDGLGVTTIYLWTKTASFISYRDSASRAAFAAGPITNFDLNTAQLPKPLPPWWNSMFEGAPIDGDLTIRLYRCPVFTGSETNLTGMPQFATFYNLSLSLTSWLENTVTSESTILTQTGAYGGGYLNFSYAFTEGISISDSKHRVLKGSLWRLNTGEQPVLAGKWLRHDRSSELLPFVQIAAQSILNQYGKPSKIFEGGIFGNGYNFFNTLAIGYLTADGQYMFLSWDYDTKKCINKAVSVQIMDEDVPATLNHIYNK